MSRHIDRMLQPDEQVIHVAGLHWIVYVKGSFVTLTGALIGHYGTFATRAALGDKVAEMVTKPLTYLSLAVIALGTLLLLVAYIRQISTDLVITSRRVIAKYGFIATTTFELIMTKVEGANIDQTVLGRMLGFGTVLVRGTGGGISPIDHVANPFRFHTYLMKALGHAQDGDKSTAHGD